MKLVNGRPTRAILDVSNNEPEAVNLMVVGGSLTTPVDAPGAPDPPVVLRNLTTQRYGVQIPAGEKETLTYAFVNEMRKLKSYYIHGRYIRDADKQCRPSRPEAEYRCRPAEPGRQRLHQDGLQRDSICCRGPNELLRPANVMSCALHYTIYLLTFGRQHLPVHFPCGCIRRHLLLHLQHLDHNALPSEEARRQGWRAREEVLRRQQACRPC